MEVFNVLLFFLCLKGCAGDFYSNVTQKGCLSFDGLSNMRKTVKIWKPDDNAIFQATAISTGEHVTMFGDFIGRIEDLNIDRSKGTLFFCIVNTTISDGGSYKYKETDTTMHVKRLYVLDKPKKPTLTVTTDGVINVQKGELLCQSFSTSAPQGLNLSYSWRVNDSVVTGIEKYKFDGSFDSILIINVDRNDIFNTYRCFAKEQRGQMSDKSNSVQIDPKRKPRITLKPNEETYSILINQTLTIECVVLDAYPNVSLFKWNKDNNPLEQSGKYFTIANARNNDTANYECVASNGVSNGTANITVDVLYGPIVTVMTALSQVDGGNIRTTCIVLSNPPKLDGNVTWTKQDNSTFIQSGIHLIINHVNRKDQGTFICSVNLTLHLSDGSSWTRSDSKTIQLNVLYGPVISPMTTYSQIEGDGIYKTCVIDSNPPASNGDVIWTKHGNSSFMQNSRQLSLSSLNRKDSGTFECTVNITFRPTDGPFEWTTDSQPFEINVLYGPEITPMTSFSQEDGYAIIKTCDVVSNPPATDDDVTWTKIGNFSFIQNDLQLYIPALNRLDNGTFNCNVSIILIPTDGRSVQRSATEDVEINVLFGPTIEPMTTYSPIEGANLTIHCMVQSNPPAKNNDVTWTKQSNTSFRQNGLQLSLLPVDKRDHGSFVCSVIIILEPTNQNNVERTDTKAVMVNVLYQPIVSISGGNVVYEGNTTTAFCIVNSNPLSDITWTYLPSKTYVPESNNISYSDYNISSQLRFAPAQCDNTGPYRCQASNNIQSPATKTITIEVKCKPRLSSLENKVENITIGRNESLNHTFEFHAVPVPMCSLRFNKTVVSDFKVDVVAHHLPYKSGCRIQKNEIMEADIGPYEITVNNSVGQSFVPFYIIFQREPDPPLLHAIDCKRQPRAATIQWKPRWNGGLGQSFFVQYKQKEDLNFTNGEKFIDDGVKEMYTDIIYKLIPGTDYIFKVSASNDKGSAETHQVNCTAVGKDEPETDTLIVIGAITGSLLGLIIVTVLTVFVIFLKRRTTNQKKGKNTQLITSSSDKLEDDEEEDGLKINPMYVSSGQIESDKNRGAIYSVVQKANKEKTDEIKVDGDSSTVYSEVVKNEKKGKGNTSTSKKKTTGRPADSKDQSIEMDCVYENSNDMKYGDGDMYANTDTDRRTPVKNENKPTKNKDGLIYADLDLAPGPNDKRFIIRGLENRNNYAVIDLSKTAEPLPSDSDSDDERDTNQTVETNGTGRQKERT